MQTTDQEPRHGGSVKNHAGLSAAPILMATIIGLIVAFCAYLIWQKMRPSDRFLHVSGRLEGYETNVGAKIGGRVDFIAPREGNEVKAGQLLVKISDDDIQAQLRGARARLAKAKRESDKADFQTKVVESQIEEAKLNWTQSSEDMAGRIRNAEANVATAQAQLEQAQAQLQQAESELQLDSVRKDRYSRLLRRGAVTQDQYDQAATNYDTGFAAVGARRAAVDAARKQLVAAQGALTQAQTSRLNPPIRTAQLLALKRQLKLAQAQLSAAKMEIDNAKAAEDEVQANIAYLNIRSPIDGIVTARVVEPGAVVVPGQTLLSLIDLDTIYLRGFVPEGEIGQVRVGQKAKVFLDSAPNKGIDGRIIEVDPVASFTPENIYFRNDRVKQVFGIKIEISGPTGFAKPGMPADAEIFTE